MSASFVSTRTLKTIGITLLLGSIVLSRTNPTHIRHVARLHPGPIPLDLLPEPPESEFLRRNHPPTSNTTFQDWGLFSLTRSENTGTLSTVGALGMVFDVRSEAERLNDQRTFDDARTEAVLRPLKLIRPDVPALRIK